MTVFDVQKARAEAANLPGIWQERWQAALDEIEQLQAAFLKAENSNLLRKQQNEQQAARIAELKAAIERHDESADNYTKIIKDLAVKNSELEAELVRMQKIIQGEPEMVLRPEVRAFADAMERKLQQNDHKGGWGNMPSSWLFRRLRAEMEELEAVRKTYIDAIEMREPNKDLSTLREAILSECADVANFAMMIADICKTIDSSEHVSAATKLIGLTKEQRAALETVLEIARNHVDDRAVRLMLPMEYGIGILKQIELLRALLTSPPAWGATAERRTAIREIVDLLGEGLLSAPYADEIAVLRAMLDEVGK